jgi:hypothetical protein
MLFRFLSAFRGAVRGEGRRRRREAGKQRRIEE